MATKTDTKRGPGRPPSAKARAAVLRATLELLAEEGYAGLTMEGVAARAGVAKTTVYRHWPTKLALVIASAHQLADEKVRVPDTGAVRGDLVAIGRGIVEAFTETPAGRILPGIVAETSRDPDLAAAFRVFWASRREACFGVLRRAIDRGELREDIDFDVVADLLYGPLHYRLLVSGMPLSHKTAEDLVDTALAGLRPDSRS